MIMTLMITLMMNLIRISDFDNDDNFSDDDSDDDFDDFNDDFDNFDNFDDERHLRANLGAAFATEGICCISHASAVCPPHLGWIEMD